MRLAKWRKDREMSQQDVADAIGCTQPYVSAIERSISLGGYMPGRTLAIAIYRLTKGAVTPNDFYDLPPIGQLDLPIEELRPAPLLERVA